MKRANKAKASDTVLAAVKISKVMKGESKDESELETEIDQ